MNKNYKYKVVNMTKQEMLYKAEKYLKKSEISFFNQFNRNGITEQEKKNLAENVEFFTVIRDMLKE